MWRRQQALLRQRIKSGRRSRRLIPLVAAVVLVVTGTGAAGAVSDGRSDPPTIVAPKWVVVPTLDGACSDAPYRDAPTDALVLAGAGAQATARMIHSGLDAYLCAGGLPSDVRELQFQIDSGGEQIGKAGILVVTANVDGQATLARSDPGGRFVAIASREEPATRSTLDRAGFRTIELRVPLEWFGGYGRSDRLLVAASRRSGALQWPASADSDPDSWGRLELAPLYGRTVSAGSVFADGLRSYLVVPFGPELTPDSLTIEAWVRTPDSDCGPVVGAGARRAFALAACGVARFDSAWPAWPLVGRTRLGAGWHYLAAVIDDEGHRALYVDGKLEASSAPAEADKLPPDRRLGPPLVPGIGPLRISGDRDEPGADGLLHGYIRDLRLWSAARTVDEIRADAFAQPSGRQPELVGWWPFAGSLADRARGHDAGVVGNAALARAAPTVDSFRPVPSVGGAPLRPQGRPPRFLRHVARRAVNPRLDGTCAALEYGESADLRLDSHGGGVVHTVLAPGGLYICAGYVFGGQSPQDVLSLYVKTQAAGDGRLDSTALRLIVTPTGLRSAARGTGTGFGGTPPRGVAAKVVRSHGGFLADDTDVPDLDIWSAELRIPMSALGPARGARMRLAARLQSAEQGNVLPAVDLSFPRHFRPDRPASWLAVGAAIKRQPVTRPRRSLARATDEPAQPTVDSFYGDGCPQDAGAPTLLNLGELSDPYVKWPLVDANHPRRRAEGTVNSDGESISDEDAFLIHASHDLDLTVTPATDADRRIQLKDGGQSNLIFENETLGISRAARPLPGDHVTAVGRWNYDCGHDPKTELHPLFILESDREELRSMIPGGPLTRVRDISVWFNSTPSPGVPFPGFVHSFTGGFTFTVDLPRTQPRPQLFVDAAKGDPGKVAVTGMTATTITFKVTPEETGTTRFHLIVGFKDGFEISGGAAYRVVFDKIHIGDNLDDGGSRGNGDWHLDVIANDHWTRLLGHDAMGDEAVVGDDSDIQLLNTSVILRAAPGDELVLEGQGYEDDSPYADPLWCGSGVANLACNGGDNVGEGTAHSLGQLSDLVGASGLHMDEAHWTLYYHVEQVPLDTPAAVLNDASFWPLIVAREPNDDPLAPAKFIGISPNVGNGPGGQQHVVVPTFVNEPPFGEGGAFPLLTDIDRFHVATSEFADVAYDPLPSSVKRDLVEQLYNDGYKPPASVRSKIGFREGTFMVHSLSGAAGNVSYTFGVNASYRTVPPDPGESQDLSGSGRPIDLTTAPLNPFVNSPDFEYAGSRTRTAPWAWQHKPSDVDSYAIKIPAATPPPPDYIPEPCDRPPHLRVSVPGMKVTLYLPGVGSAVNGVGQVETDVGTNEETWVAVVQSATGKRGVYRLTAHWDDAVYEQLLTCLEQQARKKIASVLTKPPFPGDPPNVLHGNPPPEGEQSPAVVSELGGYNPVLVGPSGKLDVVLAGPPGLQLKGLLFNSDGVLVAETSPLSGPAAATAKRPVGLVPQGRLTAGSLHAGELLYLVAMPMSSTAYQKAAVGFAQPPG